MATNRHIALIVASLLLIGPGNALAVGNAQNGMRIFKKCAACHSMEPGKNKIGPSPHGVIGRMAGTAKGYKYSKAMAATENRAPYGRRIRSTPIFSHRARPFPEQG